MKILILQISSSTDVYSSLPHVRALARMYPQVEIDFLVRSESFNLANEVLESYSIRTANVQLLSMNTAEVLEPLLCVEPDCEEALLRTRRWLDGLRVHNYEKVFNLSHTPLSSFVAHAMGSLDVVGYTRHDDEYLAIYDEMSAYFYSQGGCDRANRLHLWDLRAETMGIELQEDDFLLTHEEVSAKISGLLSESQKDYIVVDLGSSFESPNKTYEVHQVKNYIKNLTKEYHGEVFCLVQGGRQEVHEEIDSLDMERVNLLNIDLQRDFFALLNSAQVIVSDNPETWQKASYTHTPCLALSFSSLFWELGPRSQRSRVIVREEPADLPSDELARETLAFIEGRREGEDSYYYQKGLPSYWKRNESVDFSWELVQAIYFSGEWPRDIEPLTQQALFHLFEINNVAIYQLEQMLGKISENSEKEAVKFEILDRVDEVIGTLAELTPDIRPIVHWYQTEKLRLGPDSIENLIRQSREIHVNLKRMLSAAGSDQFDKGPHPEVSQNNPVDGGRNAG